MNTINTTLFQWIHKYSGQSPILDMIVVFLTHYAIHIILISVIIYFCVIYPVRTDDMRERIRRYRQAMLMMVSLFLSVTVAWILKVVVAHPRPFVLLGEVRPLVTENPLESFPSMHAVLTMVVASAVLLHHKKLGRVLVIIALIIGISRIYVGVHYPFDVIVGLLIGYLIPKLLFEIFASKKVSVSQ